jgi:hypothetical protein
MGRSGDFQNKENPATDGWCIVFDFVEEEQGSILNHEISACIASSSMSTARLRRSAIREDAEYGKSTCTVHAVRDVGCSRRATR